MAMTRFIFDCNVDKPDDLWTTERIIDELFLDLVHTCCEIKKLDGNGTYRTIHYKKYYRQALNKMYRIPLWKPTPPFIIFVSDISERVRNELDAYYKTGYKYMFHYIVMQAVGHIFENIDRAYFHQSIMKNLKVIFQ